LTEENQTTVDLRKTIRYNLTTPINTTNIYGSGAVRTQVQTVDRYQQLIQTKNSDHTIIKNTYDDVYRMISSQNERGFTTSYKYDALDRRTEMTDGLGQHTVMAYDLVGNMTSSIDVNNHSA
jgi:YD repeat-containing protein